MLDLWAVGSLIFLMWGLWFFIFVDEPKKRTSALEDLGCALCLVFIAGCWPLFVGYGLWKLVAK